MPPADDPFVNARKLLKALVQALLSYLARGRVNDPAVERHWSWEGPPGCIVLTLRDTSSQGRVNEKGIVIPDGDRYWLDPNRDYMMIRHDWFMRDPNGRQTSSRKRLARRKASGTRPGSAATFPGRKGSRRWPTRIYYFYVDFNVDLPDSLFDPPKPGRIY